MISKISAYVKQLPFWIANKYSVSVFIAILFVSFFDSYTILDLYKWRSDLGRLEEEKKYYTERIMELERDEANLSSSIQNVERFAREKYFMKKPNEEIYLIVREKN